MKAISLFSGMGGFDVALERSNMEIVAQVEKDRDCNRVLAHHWPQVKRHPDVTKFKARRGSADIVVGGWPCQDLSVAGKRAGLAGARSGLFSEVVRIVGVVRPRWVLLENVPGLLSSQDGRDFGHVLDGLVQLGYGVAWRVLDAQYAGVPQRRRRVFIVGCLGNVAGAGEILFEPTGSPWDSPPSREEAKDVAGCLGGGAAGRGWNDDTDRAGAFVGYRTSGNYGVMEQGDKTAALNCGTDPNQTIIAHTLRAEGHDASEDGTGRGVPLVVGSLDTNTGHTDDNTARANHLFAATLRSRQSSKGVNAPGCGGEDDANLVMGTLPASNGGPNDYTPIVFNPHRTLQKDGSVAEGFKADTITDALHGPTGNKEPLVGGVRRLTPLEYLRLMGFPDNHLDLEPPLSDSAKYRLCGNSVVVACVEWILHRVRKAP